MATPEDAKAPPKPAPAPKKPAPSDDEEDDGKHTIAAPKQKMLPTGLSRAIVIASILISLTVAAVTLLDGRYQLAASPNSTNGFMYRIDTLTGAVHYCAPVRCTEIPVAGTGSAE